MKRLICAYLVLLFLGIPSVVSADEKHDIFLEDDGIFPEFISLSSEMDEKAFLKEFIEAYKRNDHGRMAQLVKSEKLIASKAAVLFAKKSVGLIAEGKNQRENIDICLKIGDVFSGVFKGGYLLALVKPYEEYDQETAKIWRTGHDIKIEGNELYEKEKILEAIDKWLQAFEVFNGLNNTNEILEIVSNIGNAYDTVGQYADAVEYFKQAMEIKQKIGDLYGAYEISITIGMDYQTIGQINKGLEYYAKALVISSKIGDTVLEANTLGDIAKYYESIGNKLEAIEFHKKRQELYKKIGDFKGEARSYLDIGRNYRWLFQYDNALKNFTKGMECSRKSGNPSLKLSSMLAIGNIAVIQAKYDLALEYYVLSLNTVINNETYFDKWDAKWLWKDYDNPKSLCIYKIANIYRKLGLFDKALQFYEKSNQNVKDNFLKASNNLSMCSIYYSTGQGEKALERCQQSLEFFQKNIGVMGEGLTGKSECLRLIGSIYQYYFKQYDKALNYYQQSNNRFTSLSMGYYYYDLGKHSEAIENFSDSLRILSRRKELEGVWKAYRGLGLSSWKYGKPNEAIGYYEKAINTIESMRAGLTEKETKTFFMQDKLWVYDEFIELLETLHLKFPDKGYDRKSFEIFERKQGRVFLEEMGKSGARNFAGLPEAVRQKETGLENQLAKVQSDLVNERSKGTKDRNPEGIRTLEERQDRLKTEKEKLEEEIKDKYPDYYALKYPKPVSLSDLQKAVLNPNEAMLLYGVLKNKSYLWVITQGGFGLFALADGEAALQEKVDAFRRGPDTVIRTIQKGATPSRLERTLTRTQRRINEAAQDLFQTLLPGRAYKMIAEAKTVYVVPTGPLYGLPFEALVSQVDDNRRPHYLIEDHAVVYLSSASLLKTIRNAQHRRKTKPKYPLLAFANPVYRNATTKSNDGKALKTMGASTVSNLRSASYLDLMGGGFPELPETEAEAREIKAILKAPDNSHPLQLRQNASRSTVLSFNRDGQLDDYRYVVFSCHGVLPGEIDRVTQPALVLSNPDPQSKTDGFLTMADVFGITLNADMVTLSACNTGRGKAEKGEGVRGLTRAFMYAGTPAISVTLWSVESQSARQLSTGLYRNLEQGKNRAEALRQIKLRMIEGEAGELFKHPFFWAPVVIFGDGGAEIE